MPHIDFGKVFANGDEPAPKRDPLFEPPPEQPVTPVESSRFRRSRLGRSDWTNIIFVLIAILGGLFLAFYFFNGAEVLRTAAAWPSEMFYPRPFAPMNDTKAEVIPAAVVPAGPTPIAPLPAELEQGKARIDSSDTLPISSAFSTATAAIAPANVALTSPLGELPISPPTGDALVQVLENAGGQLQNGAESLAQQPIALVRNVAHKTSRRVATARQTAKKTISNVKQTTQSTSRSVTTSDSNFTVDPRLHVDTSPVNGTLGARGGGAFGSGATGTLGAPGGLGGGVIRSVGIGPLPILGGRH
jgi:hypothetical protein